ncbi:hat family dimerization domaincontaining protein-related [Holotrichia oblita]|uniref:Hat family dimerization domaincontaining protein-related n=1 Tax=Holotrichia oblita TaxID=644536 RepID=A0ACB9SM65_HOLOL|nr:hat family dimerization domaincontaining protein-related [Holotrichia oblita]
MIFNDDDFMGLFATDRADPKTKIKECELPSTSITSNDSFIPSITMSPSNVVDFKIDEVTMMIRTMLNDIVNRVTKPKIKILSVDIVRPLPKAVPRKTNGVSRLGKSRIYTSTPQKERIQELQTMRKQKLEKRKTIRKVLQSECGVKKKNTEVGEKGKGKAPKKKLKKIEIDFSDSDADLPQNIFHETTFFDNLDQLQNNKDALILLDDDVIHCNDYLLVKFPTNKRTLHYIGRVESCNNNVSYVLNFLRKYRSGFRFPDLQDISTVSREDIVSKILNPEAAPGTSRMSSLFNFNVNFNGYNVQ